MNSSPVHSDRRESDLTAGRERHVGSVAEHGKSQSVRRWRCRRTGREAVQYMVVCTGRAADRGGGRIDFLRAGIGIRSRLSLSRVSRRHSSERHKGVDGESTRTGQWLSSIPGAAAALGSDRARSGCHHARGADCDRLLVLYTNAYSFSDGSLLTARILLVICLALAVGFGLLLPILSLNRRRAAKRAERRYPSSMRACSHSRNASRTTTLSWNCSPPTQWKWRTQRMFGRFSARRGSSALRPPLRSPRSA